MAAILLTVGLFAFWSVLGYAALGLLRPGVRPLANALLAPVTGLALTLLPVFLLNRAGVPVGRLAWPVAGALAAAAALLLWRCRPAAPPRRYALFAASFLLALGLTGRPMLQFGFDWLSYCNGDMANYCCSAERVLRHGFDERPTPEELTSGREYALVYWLPSVPGMVRPGSELLLAWVCALSGLTAAQAFMTVMLAFHLVLVSAAGALVYRGEAGDGRGAGPALLTCGLVEASALVTLGTLYQLIAQVAGIAFLAGCASALLRPSAGLARREALRRGLLVGVFGGALLVLYPEIVPFLAVAFVVYVAAAWRRGEAGAAALGWTVGAAVAFVLVALNTFLAGPMVFLLGQAKFTSVSGRLLTFIFPYYVMPAGLADLWGLAAIGNPPGEPWLSVAIVAGAVLLLLASAAAFRVAWKGRPEGAVALVMLAVAAVLRLREDGFGLFKLAMFVQPFLLASVASAWCGLARRPLARWAPLLLLAAVGLPTQTLYLRASRGVAPYLVELPDPSRTHLLTRFTQAVEAAAPRQLVLDTVHPTLGTLQALQIKGIPASFPSTHCFYGLAFKFDEGLGFGVKSRFLPDAVAERTWALTRALNRVLPKCAFNLHDPADPDLRNRFRLCLVGRPDDNPEGRFLVAAAGHLSVFNRSHRGPESGPLFDVKPWSEVHNHLLFTPTGMGKVYPAKPEETGLYAPERDATYPDRTMAGVGRHTLYEVLKPTPKVRVVLDLTATLKHDGENRLPPAAVVGGKRVPLPLEGRGSARVWSEPLTPQRLAGRRFVGLDMGCQGTRFRHHEVGLNALTGDDLAGDPRYIVAFLRNLSVVSEEEYARRRPPALLSSFPADLANTDLEYSGLYEDSWASESVSCTLSDPGGMTNLVVRGMVPRIDGNDGFRTRLRVLLDGREVYAAELRPGDFKVRCLTNSTPGVRRVQLLFSNWQRLPGDNGRPVTARLDALGFEPPHAPLAAMASFLTDLRRPDVESSGLYTDGWATEASSCVLARPAGPIDVVVRGVVPVIEGNADFTTRLRVLQDGREVHAAELKTGTFEVRCPARGGTGPSLVQLLFTDCQRLSSADPRRVAARIEILGLFPHEP
ncbi:MAG TPA: hypothetical protein VFE78_08095 [Gemmataceae bacterium]|nr:hypothetical protein [Gemmataceae bacterium]